MGGFNMETVIDLPKELKLFYSASQKAQARMFNRMSLSLREKSCALLFGKAGWSGGITAKGLYVSSDVARAMSGGRGPTNFTKYTGISSAQTLTKGPE